MPPILRMNKELNTADIKMNKEILPILRMNKETPAAHIKNQ